MWRIAGGGLRSLLEPSLFGGKSLALPLKFAAEEIRNVNCHELDGLFEKMPNLNE